MSDDFYDIKVDKEKKEISFSHITLSYYIKQLNTKNIMKSMFGDNDSIDFSSKANYYKTLMKLGASVLKCRPGQYVKKIQANIYELWDVKPEHEKNILRDFLYSYSKKSADQELLQLYHTNVEVIEQYIKDDLYHLVPIALYTGFNTKLAKKHFGRYLWKILCNNTKTRNKALMKHYPYRNNKYLLYNYNELNDKVKLEPMRTTLINLSKVSTKVIRATNWYTDNVLIVDRMLREEKAMSKIKIIKITKMLEVIEDTKRMCHVYNVHLSETWSFERFKRIHDNLIILSRRQNTYKDYKFNWLKNITMMNKINDYEIEMVMDSKRLSEIGNDQHHCVGGYSHSVYNMNNIIFAIKRDNKIISTLSLNVQDAQNIMHCEISQHYGKANSSVSNQLERIAYTIKNAVNSQKISVDLLNRIKAQREQQKLIEIERAKKELNLQTTIVNDNAFNGYDILL